MKLLLTLILLIFSFKTPAQNQAPLKILFLGDSLTDGYGVSKEEAYPSVVGTLILKELKKNVQIINGGESGSTSKSAMGRLKWYSKLSPDILVLALGANDGLRGILPHETEKNLKEAILFARGLKMKVILVGMKMPPNYGPHHTKEFAAVFTNLAKELTLPIVNFLLQDVAGLPLLNQADMMHPNSKGHAQMAQNVFKILKDVL